MYIEQLIGPFTINTVPPATLKAFRDHGKVEPALERGLEQAEQQLAELERIGIDLDVITEKLVEDGIAAFQESGDKLLASLEQKRQAILARPLDRQQLNLGNLQSPFKARIDRWDQESFASRLSAKDYRLWSPHPEPDLADRMGWLTLPETMYEHADSIVDFANEIGNEGITQVVVLGMGGSSLAPEVFQRTFGNAPGYPELLVLDSTHPHAVQAIAAKIDISRALFIVSSKSGTTLETLSLFRYFWAQMRDRSEHPNKHFVAITDPGTPLETLAHDYGFRRVFGAPPDVGGRYAALSVFGMVPAAVAGVNVRRILDQAWIMKESGECCTRTEQCPGLALGAALGEAALNQRDKVTFLSSTSLSAFPMWIEQLIAESTGKAGKGAIPVVDEPAGKPEVYGNDRLFVHLSQEYEDDRATERWLAALESAGHPIVRLTLKDLYDLGQEFFRWEVAVAAAGSVLGINPFNQPDVELAKQLAREAMQKQDSALPDSSLELIPISAADRLEAAFENCLNSTPPAGYVCLQAYVAPTAAVWQELASIRRMLRDRLHLATTCGYGPRFLHSTGQLHKGGPDTGLFLQLLDDFDHDVPVPETTYSFGALIRAQALGDYQALKRRGRRVIRVNLGRDVQHGLYELTGALREVASRRPQPRAA